MMTRHREENCNDELVASAMNELCDILSGPFGTILLAYKHYNSNDTMIYSHKANEQRQSSVYRCMTDDICRLRLV